MKKKLLQLIVLILTSYVANTQNLSPDFWHKGVLILNTEDTIRGGIKYNIEQGIIQLETNDKSYIFTENKVFYFQFTDKKTKNKRKFYTLPYALSTQYKKSIFFEVLVEGYLTLLCRETIQTVPLNSDLTNPYIINSKNTRRALTYTYYFLDKKGTITKYNLKKDSLLKIIPKHSLAVNTYIKVNNLKVHKRQDLCRIIAFYNTII